LNNQLYNYSNCNMNNIKCSMIIENFFLNKWKYNNNEIYEYFIKYIYYIILFTIYIIYILFLIFFPKL
jgi:hypothetical protein